MTFDRRCTLASLAVLAGTALASGSVLAKAAPVPFVPAVGPRSRVIFVNDLSGDLDGLYALVHALLSPTIDIRAIVGTGTGREGETAERSVELASEILTLMGRSVSIPIRTGAPSKLSVTGQPDRSAGALAIVAEAMRGDSPLPLYVAVGGGLTEVASALQIEPRIAERMTLVWIGGDALPGGGIGETNFNIDPVAARYVFNETAVPIWQVPRAVYATCVVSASELQAFVAPHGRIGKWLYDQVANAPARFRNRLNMGETWTLGDNPLVLLTALTGWTPSSHLPAFRYENTGSSAFDLIVAPFLNDDGTFSPRSEGRKIRIYTSADNRMMLNDLFAKLRINYPAR